MRHTRWTALVLAAMVLVGGVGAVDAARSGEWDLSVLFVVLIVASAGLLLSTAVGGPGVPLRADLVRWLSSRAAVTGERPEDLADRAVAAYRAGLSVEPSGDAHDRG